jgi:hypothetical protein
MNYNPSAPGSGVRKIVGNGVMILPPKKPVRVFAPLTDPKILRAELVAKGVILADK